ncbi:hypothetical protein Angca_001158, partial [Angiostrongylus cantonensis]
QKLRQRLEELGQREVSFEDDSKELFYIKNEEKIKKSIVGIEKILYENGLLRDLDDDLHTFHSKTSQVELAMLDTGNELLNRKLMEFIEKQTSPIPPSLEELSRIMHEVRDQEGQSSNIPDPELDSAAFLDKVENVTLMVARSHQKFVSGQFLDRLDFYVPEAEREQCSSLPEIGPDLQKLLTADSVLHNLSDEIFQM